MDIPQNETDMEERVNSRNYNGWVFPWLLKNTKQQPEKSVNLKRKSKKKPTCDHTVIKMIKPRAKEKILRTGRKKRLSSRDTQQTDSPRSNKKVSKKELNTQKQINYQSELFYSRKVPFTN